MQSLVVMLVDKLLTNSLPSSPSSSGCPASALKMQTGVISTSNKLSHIPSSLVTQINGNLRRFVIKNPLGLSTGQYHSRGGDTIVCFSHHERRSAIDIATEAFGYANANINIKAFTAQYDPPKGVIN